MFQKILVPLDKSLFAEQALGAAAPLAQSSGASIDVVLVHEPGLCAASRDADVSEQKYVETVVGQLRATGLPATGTVLTGDPADKIRKRAAEVDADLIVMTSHGRTGLGRAVLGSVAEGVLRGSAMPVLMLPPRDALMSGVMPWPTIRNVLVPLDGSAFASDILPVAAELASYGKGRLILLEVVQPAPLASLDMEAPFVRGRPVRDDAITQLLMDEAERHLDGFATDLRDHGFGAVQTHVEFSENVAEGIAEFARAHSVNVIAMSTHGRGMSHHILGGIAEDVRRNCGLPVLLRRPTNVSEDAGFLSARSVERQLPQLMHA